MPGTVRGEAGSGGRDPGTVRLYPKANKRSAVVADFNADGLADLAVADGARAALTVRLGDGAGRYAAGVPLQMDAGKTTLAAGDFNGDGFSDLAVVNWQAGLVTIWIGDGMGSLTPVAALGIAPGVDAVAVKDLDGDGLGDLVMGGASKMELELRSEWTGTPEAAIRFALTEAPAGSASLEATVGAEPDTAMAGPTVASLTLSPSTIPGGSGGTSTATVTLCGPSPAGGTNVTLSSSITELAATPPPSLPPRPMPTSARPRRPRHLMHGADGIRVWPRTASEELSCFSVRRGATAEGRAAAHTLGRFHGSRAPGYLARVFDARSGSSVGLSCIRHRAR